MLTLRIFDKLCFCASLFIIKSCTHQGSNSIYAASNIPLMRYVHYPQYDFRLSATGAQNCNTWGHKSDWSWFSKHCLGQKCPMTALLRRHRSAALNRAKRDVSFFFWAWPPSCGVFPQSPSARRIWGTRLGSSRGAVYREVSFYTKIPSLLFISGE